LRSLQKLSQWPNDFIKWRLLAKYGHWSVSGHLVIDGKMRLLRVAHYTLKTVAYALCAGGCIYQIATLFKIYFSYPSTVLSLEEIMDTLKLPAISICNNNR